jgi:hypothetical protein
MSKASDALRRQTVIRMLKRISIGVRRCPGCGRETECFVKRKAPSEDTRPRCLDCWKAER